MFAGMCRSHSSIRSLFASVHLHLACYRDSFIGKSVSSCQCNSEESLPGMLVQLGSPALFVK